MINIYISYRSEDFHFEWRYGVVTGVKNGNSWRQALWQQANSWKGDPDYPCIRFAAVDEVEKQILGYIDLIGKDVHHVQLPQQEDLFE